MRFIISDCRSVHQYSKYAKLYYMQQVILLRFNQQVLKGIYFTEAFLNTTTNNCSEI